MVDDSHFATIFLFSTSSITLYSSVKLRIDNDMVILHIKLFLSIMK